jgi:hypothetical membrane protein
MKRYGLLCGPLAALTLWAGIVVLAQRVPGYDSVRQTVSEIGEMDSPMRGPFAVMLFVTAFLMLVFAWALYRTAKEAGRSTLPVTFIGFVAIPLVGIGVCAFPHPLHNVFGLLELVAYFAPIVLAFTWRRAPGAKDVVAFSWIMSVAVWLVILANMTPMFRPEPLWHEMKPFYGIVQRALFVSWLAWVAGLGLMLFRQDKDVI